MKSRYKELERKKKDQLIKEYSSKGYQVFEDPREVDLKTGFTPDLILIKGTEKILIEIKSGQSIRKTKQEKQYLRELKDQGWQIQLVVTNPRDRNKNLEDEFQLLEDSKILEFIKFANDKKTPDEIALINLWVALEAISRRLYKKSKEKWNLIQNLYTLGDLNVYEYTFLKTMYEERNRITHGFDSNVDRADIDRLIKLVEKLRGMLAPSHNMGYTQ